MAVDFGGIELLSQLLDIAICCVIGNVVVALVAVDIFVGTDEYNARVSALFVVIEGMFFATSATPKVLAVQASPDALCRPAFGFQRTDER